MVQFDPQFKFYFPLFLDVVSLRHRETKFKQNQRIKLKLNHNIQTLSVTRIKNKIL